MAEPFAIVITCPNCGQSGTLVAPESGAPDQTPGRTLIKTAPGFHQEVGRTRSGEAVIVCDSCDEIQTGKIPPA